MTTSTSTFIQVQRDLTQIIDLHTSLLGQAINDAGAQIDGRSLPGGKAMVALAPVARLATWERHFEEAERDWRSLVDQGHKIERPDWGSDEDDSWEPTLQTLRFWSDGYRRARRAEWDHQPTINTEAKFLKHELHWIQDHDPNWNVFVKDIAGARRRLENVLAAGERAERGVPCMYDECRGVRLVRKMELARDTDGHKVWRHSDWHCPRCHRSWTHDGYLSQVAAASWAAQSETISGETWCSAKYAARQIGRPESTVRAWISKGHFRVACMIAGRRTQFVPLTEVEQRDRDTTRRSAAS